MEQNLYMRYSIIIFMKITVDTKEDSPEDIRKVIALLSSLANKNITRQKNIFEESSPGLDPLDQRTPTQQETSQPAESDIGNAFTSLFGDSGSENKPEEKKEKSEIEIVPY